MDITPQRAELVACKTNNLISNIFKQMTELQAIMSSDEYEAIFRSDNTTIMELREDSSLPFDFLDYLDTLPEMF
jgi:hypothetical protein